VKYSGTGCSSLRIPLLTPEAIERWARAKNFSDWAKL